MSYDSSFRLSWTPIQLRIYFFKDGKVKTPRLMT